MHGLGDHAIEAGALEAFEPLGRNGAIARHRGQIDRGRAAAEERFELGAPLGLGVRAEIAAVDRQEIEADEARRRRLGQLGDARGRGMEPELERVEVEPRGGGDHNLPVDHAPVRQPLTKDRMQVGKVPVEWTKVAALDEDVLRAAEDKRAKPVPLRLEEKPVARRQSVSQLRQHRLNRRRDREICHRELNRDNPRGHSRLNVPGRFWHAFGVASGPPRSGNRQCSVATSERGSFCERLYAETDMLGVPVLDRIYTPA